MHTTPRTIAAVVTTAMLTVTVAGCGKSESQGSGGPAAGPSPGVAEQTLASEIFQATPPAGEKPVSEVKSSANVGDEIVIRVVIGGRKQPFVEGRAIMTVVDHAMFNRCVATGDGHCATPWDYCCATVDDLRPNIAGVQFTDESGKALELDLRKASDLKPLDTIVVKGVVAHKSGMDSMLVSATAVHVVKP